MRRYETYNVLSEVYFKDRHAHLVLKNLDLKAEDQAFVSALVYTSLQHSLFLDYQFADLVDTKLPKEIQLIIKMGCAQHFKMNNVPDYAIVNESVALAKRIKKHRYAGVVNAVLKQVIKRGERPLIGDALHKASITYSMPLWILKLLAKQYDETFSLEYAAYCAEIKPTYVRVNTLKKETIDMALFEKHQDMLIAKPAFFKSDALKRADVLVQDINSQKVVEQMALEKDMTVLDCCCGPGTKTSQIAAVMNNTGHIDGVELHASRADATIALMERANVRNATIYTSDVLDFTADTLYDRILLDAPCSGLGVLSHKHDLRYHIQPQDLDALIILQQKMLAHVASMVAVGGLITYATCTLNRKENGKQVEQFLATHPEFTMTYEETLNPMMTQGDGFYIANLKRTC